MKKTKIVFEMSHGSDLRECLLACWQIALADECEVVLLLENGQIYRLSPDSLFNLCVQNPRLT